MPLDPTKKSDFLSEKIKQQEILIHHLLTEKSQLTTKLAEEMQKRGQIEAENKQLSQCIMQLAKLKKSAALLEEEKKTLLFKLNAHKKLTQALVEGFEQTKRDQEAEIEKLEKVVVLLKATQESNTSFKRANSPRTISKAPSFFKHTIAPTPPKTTSFRRQ